MSSPVRFANSVVLAGLMLASTGAVSVADEAPAAQPSPSQAAPGAKAAAVAPPTSGVQPPMAAPEQAPPPPPPAGKPTVAPAQAPVQPPGPQAALPEGQWVYTSQYGWVWMPYGSDYTYVYEHDGSDPYMYLYYPAFGWTWVLAPWIWGMGPAPYFGVLGWGRFGWYGHGAFGHPWYGFNTWYGHRGNVPGRGHFGAGHFSGGGHGGRR